MMIDIYCTVICIFTVRLSVLRNQSLNMRRVCGYNAVEGVQFKFYSYKKGDRKSVKRGYNTLLSSSNTGNSSIRHGEG